MPVGHSPAIRNALATTVVTAVDQGNVTASGTLVIYDANGNVISRQPMSLPAFVLPPVNGTCQANPIAQDNAPVSGAIPASYQVQDRNGRMIFGGSCGPTGDLGCPNAPLGAFCNTSTFAYNAPP